MTSFRNVKSAVRLWLKRHDWTSAQPLPFELEEDSSIKLVTFIGPLFACLPEGDIMTERAAYALGHVLNRLYVQSPEDARNIVRRFIWQMNEESGNIGWGIPEAFGATLAQNQYLAQEYHSILFNYINDKEGDNTFCDYAPLRRSCFKAVAVVLTAWPQFSPKAVPLLEAAVHKEEDEICRNLAKEILATL